MEGVIANVVSCKIILVICVGSVFMLTDRAVTDEVRNGPLVFKVPNEKTKVL